MPTITRIALGVSLLLSLSAPALAQDACAATSEGTAKLADYPAVRAFYDAMSLGNADLVDCAVSAGWTNTPGAPGTPAGPDGFKPTVAGIGAAFSQYDFETQDVVADGDKVVVRSLVTVQQALPFLGIEAGGDPVQFQTIDIHQLDAEGKLAQSWHVEDWLTFLLARGALPIK